MAQDQSKNASSPEIFDCRLRFPCSIVICGASFSGKSFLTLDIIRRRNDIFRARIDKVVYVFANYQPHFKPIEEQDKNVIFVNSREQVDEHLSSTLNCLVVFDDQMLSFEHESKSNKEITDWFIRRAHHENVAIVCILQNLFPKSLRCVMLNTMYLIAFKNVRDKASLINLNSQFMPTFPRYLLEAMEDASQKSYGYLLLDFSSDMHDRFRVRNFIYPTSDMKVYVPKKKNE